MQTVRPPALIEGTEVKHGFTIQQQGWFTTHRVRTQID